MALYSVALFLVQVAGTRMCTEIKSHQQLEISVWTHGYKHDLWWMGQKNRLEFLSLQHSHWSVSQKQDTAGWEISALGGKYSKLTFDGEILSNFALSFIFKKIYIWVFLHHCSIAAQVKILQFSAKFSTIQIQKCQDVSKTDCMDLWWCRASREAWLMDSLSYPFLHFD